MEWGSTKAGELLTTSNAWKVRLSGENIRLWVESRLEVDAHIIQLQSIELEDGLIWSSCKFEFQLADRVSRLVVDGIPNALAKQMHQALILAVVDALAAFVAAKTQGVEAWVDRAVDMLRQESGKLAGSDEIEDALESVVAPSTPGGISWDSILHHKQCEWARRRGMAWPGWISRPADEVAKRLEAYNKAKFSAAFENWLAGMRFLISGSRWIPKGTATGLAKSHPVPIWPGKTWHEIVGDKSPRLTLEKLIDDCNREHIRRQKSKYRSFFEIVEKKPLTEEQMQACICMDDAVLIVAAAGSGKTSTMVAKVGYLLQENLAAPEQILLLAFNRVTAEELGGRISGQLRNWAEVDRVRSNTFHSFGIDVIAKATGKKPTLAPWVDPEKPGEDLREIQRIVQHLAANDSDFKREWDVFRTIYGRDVGKWGQVHEPDAHSNGKRGFLTAGGEIVKSKEERIIADWLFYHHVRYKYERAYEFDTADENYRQYFPDFYYPDAKIYHEHFALNKNGEAPEIFEGYLEGVNWKRSIHREKKTVLIETTSYSLATGQWSDFLRAELSKRGIQPVFDPDRRPMGLKPVSEKELIRSFRIFQQHVKNNGLSPRELDVALARQSEEGFGDRLSRFLKIFKKISSEWEKRLQAGGFVDFEDMLIQAAKYTESGAYQSQFTAILADEFQDSSRARVRLLKALASAPKTQAHVCVVGDDWQGINRFAGSDISVMTDFERIFKNATKLTLSTTFRCPEEICRVSGNFIQANPAQLRKTVRTTNAFASSPIRAYGFKDAVAIQAYIETQLGKIHHSCETGRLQSVKGERVSVMLLGRYRSDTPSRLETWQARFGDKINIEFRTVHGSKGLEAEYVFLLNMLEGSRGFPSQIQDDPALQLAMPSPDPYPFAEERRLFYVALTRARKQVRICTLLDRPSQFLVELHKSGQLEIRPVGGDAAEPCPKCGRAFLKLLNGRHGKFYACARFPACDYKRNDRQKPSNSRQARPQ